MYFVTSGKMLKNMPRANLIALVGRIWNAVTQKEQVFQFTPNLFE